MSPLSHLRIPPMPSTPMYSSDLSLVTQVKILTACRLNGLVQGYIAIMMTLFIFRHYGILP
jgi:hypothetical protein